MKAFATYRFLFYVIFVQYGLWTPAIFSPKQTRLPELPALASQGSGPLYYIIAVEKKEKQKLIRREIPAIWLAIWEDREMSAACEM